MKYLKYVIRPYLNARYVLEQKLGLGSFGSDPAKTIKEKYVPSGNWVKDGLHNFHVKQFHESSCSVASVVSAVNTLKDYQCRKSNPGSTWTPVSQHDLLDAVRAAHWKERMSEHGYNGRRGLPLEVLGEVTKASLEVYGIDYQEVEIIQTTRHPDKITAYRQKLAHHLTDFEKNAGCLLIVHFDQGTFLREMHIPHISPVGGYDPETKKVKILDVDSEVQFPYELSFDRFYDGLSTNYNAIFRHYGYAEGGYILINL